MEQYDSLALSAHTSADTLPKEGHTHQITPAMVISWLPKNATPAQMDSAIQRHIKPSAITWSNMPDTLHLPGHSKGKSCLDVTLPQYYKESFFSKDSLFHPELSGGRLGVAGDPIPYSIGHDNFFTSLLLGCFVLAMVSFSQSRRFIARQVKNFTYVPHAKVTEITETSSELRFQLFLVLNTCLMLALGFFFYTRTYVGETFALEPYEMIGIYAGVAALYFIAKSLLYWFASWVFFNRKKNEQWMKSFLFITSTEGVALFPMVILQTYFELPVQSAIIYISIIVILVKILSLYKTFLIFFRHNGSFMQIILYFCALEIAPLLASWGVLVTINSHLKINF